MSAGVRYARQSNYELTIRNLITNSSEGVSGAEAVVSILDGALEIDSVTLSGKVRSGFCRSFARESSYHNVGFVTHYAPCIYPVLLLCAWSSLLTLTSKS